MKLIFVGAIILAFNNSGEAIIYQITLFPILSIEQQIKELSI